jgi:hypothetical protein
MQPTLSDIAKLLYNGDRHTGDVSIFGKIEDIDKTDGSYYVSIAGSKETVKAQKLVGAQKGDTVLATIRPTGNLVVTSRLGGDKDALDAKAEAEAVSQYFWTKDGDDSEAGAHITEVPREAFEQDPQGGNMHIRSRSISLRDGTDVLSRWDRDKIQMGRDESARMEIKPNTIDGYNAQNVKFFAVDSVGSESEEKIVLARNISFTSNTYQDVDELAGITNPFVIDGYLYLQDNEGRRITYANSRTGNIKSLQFSDDHTTLIIRYEISSPWTTGSPHSTTIGVNVRFADSSSGYASIDLGYQYVDGEHRLYMNNMPDNYMPSSELTVSLYEMATTYAPCFAFGTNSGSRGKYSAAIGEGLMAASDNQIVAGKYNNNKSNNVLEIGDGTDNNNRSNAFEIDNNGHILCNELAPFTTYTVTGTATINPGGGAAIDCTGTIPTGYTPIAIQGVTSNHAAVCSINRFQLITNGAAINIHNNSSTAQDVTVTVTILCTSLM